MDPRKAVRWWPPCAELCEEADDEKFKMLRFISAVLRCRESPARAGAGVRTLAWPWPPPARPATGGCQHIAASALHSTVLIMNIAILMT